MSDRDPTKPLLCDHFSSPGLPLEQLDRRPRPDGRPLLCDRRLNDGRGCRPAAEDGDEPEPEQADPLPLVSDLFSAPDLIRWMCRHGHVAGGRR